MYQEFVNDLKSIQACYEQSIEVNEEGQLTVSDPYQSDDRDFWFEVSCFVLFCYDIIVINKLLLVIVNK